MCSVMWGCPVWCGMAWDVQGSDDVHGQAIQRLRCNLTDEQHCTSHSVEHISSYLFFYFRRHNV